MTSNVFSVLYVKSESVWKGSFTLVKITEI